MPTFSQEQKPERHYDVTSVEHEVLEVVVEYRVLDVVEHPPDVVGVDGGGEVVEERLAVVTLQCLEPATKWLSLIFVPAIGDREFFVLITYLIIGSLALYCTKTHRF